MDMTTTATNFSAMAAGTTVVPSDAAASVRGLADVGHDPLLFAVIVLALVCCTGGVMATIYAIRKKRKERRERKVIARIPLPAPIYRPVRVMVEPPQRV